MVDGERLVWPWDVKADTNELPEESPEFVRALADGRRAEFAEKRHDRAGEFYGRSAGSARLALA